MNGEEAAPGLPSVVPTVSEGGRLTPGSRSRHRQGLLLATGRDQAWDLALLCLTGVQSCHLPQAPCPALPSPCPHRGGHCGLWLSHTPDLATLTPPLRTVPEISREIFPLPAGAGAGRLLVAIGMNGGVGGCGRALWPCWPDHQLGQVWLLPCTRGSVSLQGSGSTDRLLQDSPGTPTGRLLAPFKASDSGKGLRVRSANPLITRFVPCPPSTTHKGASVFPMTVLQACSAHSGAVGLSQGWPLRCGGLLMM